MTGKKDDQMENKKNDIIFKQGDQAPCMYDIVSGSVGIFVNYGAANEKQLTTLTAGQFFGEMGMIDSSPRSATAVVLEDGTQIREISAENFSTYFAEEPDKVLQIMQHMSQRIRGLTQDYLNACRAVVEATEAQETGKAKSNWLQEHLKRFMEDYELGVASGLMATTPEQMVYMRHW